MNCQYRRAIRGNSLMVTAEVHARQVANKKLLGDGLNTFRQKRDKRFQVRRQTYKGLHLPDGKRLHEV